MRAVYSNRRLRWWAAVGALALAGLALRIAAARGGLWTDEAWSVVYAARARDAAGVFLRINHDNNHHLYSLWLQAIGPGAAPLLARAPAILAGSLAVVVAALFAGRRSPTAGIVAALLFSVTPLLVVIGSEARGYAMMLLAALVLLLLVSDAIEGRAVAGAKWWLALVALLGMLSHLTMAAPVAIAAAWTYIERRGRLGPAAAVPATIRLIGPALAVTAGVVLFVFGAAAQSPTGMQLGGYEPFAASHYEAAIADVARWTTGLASPLPWLIPVAIAAGAMFVAFRTPEWLGKRAPLYSLLIVAVPLAALLLRAGNSSFARYYLATALGLLLFAAEWIGRGLAGPRAVRVSAGLAIAVLASASLYRDLMVIAVDRGRPAAVLADIATVSPSGARIAFAEPRLKAVVAVAAERSGYQARFAGGCAPADFLLAAQSRWTATPPSVDRCGVAMDAIDSSVTIPISGDSWVLYRARRLQSVRAADSGRPPAA